MATMTELEQETKLADEKQEVRTVNPANLQGLTANQTLAAYHAALHEHSQSVREALRVSRKAIFWMLILGLLTTVDRLNEALLQSFQSIPSFQKEFGTKVKNTKGHLTYSLSAYQQQMLSNIPNVFHILGLLVFGYVVDRLGNRYITLITLLLVIANTFLTFYAHNFAMVLMGTSIQTGLAGFLGAVSPTWTMELSPLALRPYVLIYIHLCNNIGQLLAAVMGQHYAARTDPWGWRLPYAISWGLPVPLMVFIWFAPESPWWLVRHGREPEALKSLARLNNHETDDESTVALITHTVQLEKSLQFGGSFWAIFKGVNRRRTEIAFMAAVSLDLCVFGLKSAAYFLQAAGLSATDSFSLTCGQNAIGILATLCAGLIIKKLGRRGMWLTGTACMAVNLALVGALALAPKQTPSVIWPQGVFVIMNKFFVGISVGSLSAILTAEIGSVQLRRKTQAMGLIGYDVADLVSGAVAPYLINPDEANLEGKAAWIPAGINVLLFIYGYFRVPETRGRNSEELDILFAEKVPARKFATYKIDVAQEFGLKEDGSPSEPAAPKSEAVLPTLE